MGAGHPHLGYSAGNSWLHGAEAPHKIVAALLFVIAVVAVPAHVWWPFALAATLVVGAIVAARLRLRSVARRMLIEVPFVVFALALPFFARGDRIDVLGLSLSESGLLAAASILIKGTIGVLVGIVLASTTRPSDLLDGLHRLHLPQLLVQIASFMLRYLAIVGDDVRRMRIARESRCFTGTGLRAAGAVAHSAGALFVRSYERGERVHLAMLARGYAGHMPQTTTPSQARPAWQLVLAVTAVAAATTVAWIAA